MAFKSFKYESDDGEIYLCRMSQALKTAFAANTEPSAEVTRPFHVQASGSKKQNGIIPRHVIATRTFGTGNDTGTKSVRVAIFDPTKLEGETPAINIGTTFTYLGNTWTVSSVEPEEAN